MSIKKILYCDSPRADYGSAMLWEGLCRILGNENIIVYPYKEQFHNNSPWPYISLRDNIPLSDNDNIDFILFSYSPHGENKNILQRLKSDKPIVLIDQTEDCGISPAVIQEFKPIIIFKREYILNREYPHNCHPLPFSAPYPIKNPDSNRPIDVFIGWRDANYPLRKTIRQKVEAMDINHYCYDTDASYLSWKDYYDLLSQAKIGISVRGFGFDTNRFLEIISAGALLLSDESALIKPYPFIHKKHCVYFHEYNIEWTIEHYLYHKDIRKHITVTGWHHLKSYHTVEARAQYLLDIVKKNL